MRSYSSVLFLLGLASATVGQQPALLADINTTPASSGSSMPEGFATLGAATLFAADGLSGTELYKTFGAPGTTSLVVDIRPGVESSDPRELTAAGGLLFFTADDGNRGRELWVSDGTAAGTRLVIDLIPGGGLRFVNLTALGSRVLFTAPDLGQPVFSEVLWSSDGTAAGTLRLTQGPASPTRPVALGGAALFTVGDRTTRELWRTDGTVAGTQLVTGLPVTGRGAFLGPAVGGLVFFALDATLGDTELWKTDGTAAGTQLVKDIRRGVLGSLPILLTAAQDRLFFTADDGVNGREVWVSDGTAQGTTLVADLQPMGSLFVSRMVAFGRDLLFGANNALWGTDGTATGTLQLQPNLGVFAGITTGGQGLFAAFSPVAGTELWATDGSVAGTRLVRDIRPGANSSLLNTVTFGLDPTRRRALFAADDGQTGREPWVSDGTMPGTRLLDDLQPSNPLSTAGSTPTDFVDLFGTGLFRAQTPDFGSELWRTDGTTAGTALLLDIAAGAASSRPFNSTATALVRAGSQVFFSATDGVAGIELWRTDGTSRGTTMVVDLRPGSRGSSPGYLTAFGNQLLFAGGNDTTGRELRITDGTAAGTRLLADLVPGAGSSLPTAVTAAEGYAVFAAQAPGIGNELWRTDGTPQGTVLVADVEPGLGSSNPQSMVAMGDKVFFSAFTVGGSVNAGLWVTDGTAAGTVRLTQTLTTPLGALDDVVLFANADAQNGVELWRSDGTVAGTRLLLDIHPGSESSNPGLSPGVPGFGLEVRAGDRLFFFADDGTTGRELWASDGTISGTQRVADVTPGSGSTLAFGLSAAGARHVLFGRLDGGGTELWLSDGTAQGTRSLRSFNGLALTFSQPLYVTSGGRVLFSATDSVHGAEPWTLDPGALAQPAGGGCGATLRADDPVLGQSVSVRGRAAPGSLGVLLVSASLPPVQVTPTACMLFVDALTMATVAQLDATSGRWSTAFRVPNAPALVGLPVALQAMFGPGTGPRGVDLSDGALLTLGF